MNFYNSLIAFYIVVVVNIPSGATDLAHYASVSVDASRRSGFSIMHSDLTSQLNQLKQLLLSRDA